MAIATNKKCTLEGFQIAKESLLSEKDFILKKLKELSK
jgi:hypothetical protein